MTRRGSMCKTVGAIQGSATPLVRALMRSGWWDYATVVIDRGRGPEEVAFHFDVDLFSCSDAPVSATNANGEKVRPICMGHTYPWRGVLWMIVHPGEIHRMTPAHEFDAFVESLVVVDVHERIHLVLFEQGLDPDPEDGAGLRCEMVSYAEAVACNHMGWATFSSSYEPEVP